MIGALLLMTVGLIASSLCFIGIVMPVWVFPVAQGIYMIGLLVAASIWNDVTERIKKLEEKVKQNDQR